MEARRRVTQLTVLAAVFAVALVVSNTVAGKLIQVGPVVLTAAVFLFPVVYIIGDVVPEVYGLKAARQVIWLGFVCNTFAVVVFTVAILLPHPEFFDGQEAYATVLGFTPRLLLASMVAYLVGTNVNAWVMVAMKRLTHGRWLWTRTIGSTILGEGVDSLLFVTIGFAGILPLDVLFTMVWWQWAFKSGYEVVATPLTYGVVGLIRRVEARQE